jgi:hypothetical protein
MTSKMILRPKHVGLKRITIKIILCIMVTLCDDSTSNESWIYSQKGPGQLWYLASLLFKGHWDLIPWWQSGRVAKLTAQLQLLPRQAPPLSWRGA